MNNPKKEMICIVCPMSCHLEVEQDADGTILNISGNTCPRGKAYATSELTHPTRMLTSTVALEQAHINRLPVITSGEIPKAMIRDVMAEIHRTKVCAPVRINDIIIENVCGLDVHIKAGRSVERIDI